LRRIGQNEAQSGSKKKRAGDWNKKAEELKNRGVIYTIPTAYNAIQIKRQFFYL
jgi:hypothetical protein